MNSAADKRRPGPMAVLCYFLLAFPAAGTPAMLFGIVQSAAPQQQFEGSGATGVVVAMVMAYVVSLLVILGSYPALHGKAKALYIGNGILGAMTLVLWISLAWHHII